MEERETTFAPALTLMALAISAFAIGSTEFISVGVMPLIIQTFGISLSTAGLTVSIYAGGIVIGAPLLTAVTGRIQRKQLLMLIMGVFIIGNVLTAAAPTFPILLAGRLVASFAHGVFMSVATMIAANVVTPEKRASAIATMFTGLTVATVTGVPLGTFIGQHASWRISFLVIAAVGLVGAIANFFLVPSQLAMPAPIKRGSIMRLVKTPVVLVAMLATALGYGSSFPVYTYLTAILGKQGFSTTAIVIILIAYGLAVAFGNVMGGRFANIKPLRALTVMFTLNIVLMLAMLVWMMNQGIGLILVVVLGVLAYINVPGLQLYTMQAAEKLAPDDVQMASALNISAFNIGIMLGSTSGGWIVDSLGLQWTPIASLIMSALALISVLWLARKEK